MFKIIKILCVCAFSGQFARMAWMDHKKKMVPLKDILLLAGLSVAYGGFQICLIGRDELFWFLLDIGEGILIGIVFIGISLMSSQKIGLGDSLLILILGIFAGGWRVISILEISCVLLLCRALWIWKKKGAVREERIPFYPFLFLGFLVTFFLRAAG